MDALGTILPIIIYVLLICLLIVGIILGIKLIITIDKVNEIADDLQHKVESLNDIFSMLNFARNKISNIGNRLSSCVMSFVNKLFGFGKGKEEEDDYE